MSILVLFSALALMGPQDAQSTPASPAEPPAATATETPAPATTRDPMDQVTCRSEAVVGSRFGSRICMTRRQWNQRREESRALARRLEVQNSNRDRITAPGH